MLLTIIISTSTDKASAAIRWGSDKLNSGNTGVRLNLGEEGIIEGRFINAKKENN